MKKQIKEYKELEENLKYIENKEELELIKKAYLTAERLHENQVRDGGEAYITHPLNVAYLLSTIHSNYITIIAGLLHDTVEDTNITLEEIEECFGIEVRNIVEGLSKINKIIFDNKEQQLLNYQRKLLVSLVEDVRVIIIKLADRLHNLRTLANCSTEKQKRIATETLEIYTPLAHRLGMHLFKGEMEDLSLRYTKPKIFYEIAEKLNSRKQERDQVVNEMLTEVNTMLNENSIKHSIKGRSKSIYSIYKKLSKGKKFEEIYDLLALRIIVDSISDCYLALGLIHSKYKLISFRFKDYIAQPKTNMYQSLHTTVFGKDGNLFEIQIRTKEMDSLAEDGVASHWSYKEGTKNDSKAYFEQKLLFFKSIMELNNDESDNEEFIRHVKEEILPRQSIYVYTPKGNIIELPCGATPIDFAYKIHSQIGDKMVGVIVNDGIVSFDYKLKTGDIVKIKTNSSSSGPSHEWLNIAATTQAKNKIKAYYLRQNKDEIIENNKELLERELKKNNIIIKDFYTNNFDKLLQILKLKDENDLYFSLKDRYTPAIIIHKYQEINKRETKKITFKEANQNSNQAVIAGGDAQIKTILGKCCNPIKHDNIIGYVSTGKGIIVHCRSCHNIMQVNDKMIDVAWNENVKEKYKTKIKLELEEKTNSLVNIIKLLNNLQIGLNKMKSNSDHGIVIYELTILVYDKEHLEKLIANLEKFKEVIEVKRIMD